MWQPLAVLGLVAAALMVGLYLGERGRRRAAERMLVRGSPEESAGPSVSRVVGTEPEQRMASFAQDFSREAVDRGVAVMKARAELLGVQVDERQLRAEAERMLGGEDIVE